MGVFEAGIVKIFFGIPVSDANFATCFCVFFGLYVNNITLYV